jgi:hypothetical protein
MTGSGLMDFLISMILLIATGFIFFLVIDRLAPDPILNKIGKVAVGVVLLIVFLLAIKAVLFGGAAGGHLAPQGFIWFCIGVIVILVVMFIIGAVLDWIAGSMGIGAPIVTIVKYVIFAVALIALLVIADQTLMGGSYTGAFNSFRPRSQLGAPAQFGQYPAYNAAAQLTIGNVPQQLTVGTTPLPEFGLLKCPHGSYLTGNEQDILQCVKEKN